MDIFLIFTFKANFYKKKLCNFLMQINICNNYKYNKCAAAVVC